MRALLMLVLVAACGPTTPSSNTPPVTGATPDAAPPPPTATGDCVADQGCPAADAIPACAGRMAARPFAEIMDKAAQHVGKEVYLAGTLYKSGSGCTRMYCGDRGCCNRCSARVELGPDASLGLNTTKLPLINDAAEGMFACGGDDTGVCCGIPLDGGVVVVTGLLSQEGSGYALRDAKVCAP